MEKAAQEGKEEDRENNMLEELVAWRNVQADTLKLIDDFIEGEGKLMEQEEKVHNENNQLENQTNLAELDRLDIFFKHLVEGMEPEHRRPVELLKNDETTSKMVGEFMAKICALEDLDLENERSDSPEGSPGKLYWMQTINTHPWLKKRLGFKSNPRDFALTSDSSRKDEDDKTPPISPSRVRTLIKRKSKFVDALLKKGATTEVVTPSGTSSQNKNKLNSKRPRKLPQPLENSQTVDDSSDRNKERTPFQCSKCPKRFTIISNRKRHEKEQHSENKKIYMCKECNKEFTIERGLLDHFRYDHANAGKLKCRLCGRVLLSTQSLSNHRKICKKVGGR